MSNIQEKRKELASWDDDEKEAVLLAYREAGGSAQRFVAHFNELVDPKVRLPAELQVQLRRMERNTSFRVEPRFMADLDLIIGGGVPAPLPAATSGPQRSAAVPGPPAEEWKSIVEAAGRVGHSRRAILSWARAGLVKSKPTNDPNPSRLQVLYLMSDVEKVARWSLAKRRKKLADARKDRAGGRPSPRPPVAAPPPRPAAPDSWDGATGHRDRMVAILVTILKRDGVAPTSFCPLCVCAAGERHATETGHGLVRVHPEMASAASWKL